MLPIYPRYTLLAWNMNLDMWIRLVGSLKLQVSLENIGLFCRALLHKRPVTLRSLLIVATLYVDTWRRGVIGCPFFIGHFPQKSPIIGGSFAKNDLHLKGGPEPLENEINKILGSKCEDRFSDHFCPIWYKISVQFVFRTCFASAFSVRPRGTCKSSRRSARR